MAVARDLAGRTALVTGASRGLGRAMAIRLAAAGALVGIGYASNAAAAHDTLARIEGEGGQAFLVPGALAGEAEGRAVAEAMLGALAARGGGDRLDILVNNIGGGDYGPIGDMTEALYDHMMQNNCRGAFFLTKALHGALADNGRVVNISSTGSRLTDPNIIVYTMAKAAVDAFTRVLAADLGPRGITVNAVAPGFTAGETNLHVTEDPELARGVIDHTMLRRFGQPEEIADIVHFLASDAGRWVTGAVIDASGGFKR